MSYSDGSIWQGTTRSGKTVWFIEVKIGVKANGQPRMTRRQAETKAAAIKLRQELNSLKSRGQLNQRSNITVADYGRYWSREVKPNSVKVHTATGYEWLLTKYVYPYLGKRKMADLTYPMVQDWMNDLLACGYGHSTVNSARSVLGQISKQAMREGILSTNPVALTVKVKKQIGDKTQVRDPWTKEEAQKALQVSKGTDMDLFVHLCLHLGLRHGEALGLTYEAIDFEKRTIQVKFTLKDERRITGSGQGIVRIRLQEPKTKASIRTLVISDTLYESFERHKMAQTVRRLKAGKDWKESGLVITTTTGTPVSQPNNLKRFKDWVKLNNLRYIRIHDLRHTFGTLALEGDIPLEQVSQVMGHSDIGITKKIYAPSVRGFNEKAILAMESFLNPEITVPSSWTIGAEPLSDAPLEITQPVKLSRRPMRTQLTEKRHLQ